MGRQLRAALIALRAAAGIRGRGVALWAPWVLTGCATVSAPASIDAFSTDGCSMFPDRSPTLQVDWCDCCVAHDLAYWRGGSEDERLQADLDLKRCVAQRTGNAGLAQTMFAGVRAGGSPYVQTPFRWGYGWSFGRGYQELTPAEAEDARAKEDAYRAAHPGMPCPSMGDGLDHRPVSGNAARARCGP
jgi:hypothetical protein